jgi:hypothetical protein
VLVAPLLALGGDSIKPSGKDKLHRLRGHTPRELRKLGAPGLKRLHRFRDRAVGSVYAPLLDIFDPFSDATIHD